MRRGRALPAVSRQKPLPGNLASTLRGGGEDGFVNPFPASTYLPFLPAMNICHTESRFCAVLPTTPASHPIYRDPLQVIGGQLH